MRDIEEVIQKAVVYLGEVQQVENRYRELHAGGGINVFASWVLPEKTEALSKEAQEKIEEREKAIEAERRKVANQAQHVHLPVLHGQVYDWWDVIEEAEDTAKRERLRELADSAIERIDRLERYLGLSYDTLRADNTPHESSDRSKCHARQEHEKWAWADEMTDVVSCPEQVLDDLSCKEFAKYHDEQGAWAVNAAFRMAAWLRHWAEEEMTEKVFRYYVYGTAPCSYRLQDIITEASNMNDLLTHWRFHNPELSKTLQELYGTLQKAAKNTDRYYKRLSILPYWNEKDFDPREVKKCATQLCDTLLHIASMGLEKLEGTEQTKIGPGQAGGTVNDKMSQKAMYVFKRCGETGYFVAFGNNEMTVPRVAGKLPGLDYIHVLMKHEADHNREPNRVHADIPSAMVIRKAKGALADQTEGKGEPGRLMDATTWRQAQKRLQELSELAESETDPGKAAEYQDEREQLKTQLARDTHPTAKGKPESKSFAGDASKKHGAVRMAIERAITNISSVDQEFANHLKDHIKHYGGGHRYAPDSHIDWVLE